ncbi:MAG: hypothetical protein IT245_06795 [Bacteroidia bacterium]|nr:hypothetical protein [Bacteroidia bacterium]
MLQRNMTLDLPVQFITPEGIKKRDMGESIVDCFYSKDITFYSIDFVFPLEGESKEHCIVGSSGIEFQVMLPYDEVKKLISDQRLINFN